MMQERLSPLALLHIPVYPRGYFLVKDNWGCAAGWGRIFTTGLTIMEYIFSRVTRMGSPIFGIFGIRKFW